MAGAGEDHVGETAANAGGGGIVESEEDRGQSRSGRQRGVDHARLPRGRSGGRWGAGRSRDRRRAAGRRTMTPSS